MIKFPTEYRVREVRRDQVVACECYIAMLEMDEHLQTMCIEEQQIVVESVEGLEEVLHPILPQVLLLSAILLYT